MNTTDNITVTIPLTLTASQIIRGSPAAISESEALELARELHDLVTEVQARYCEGKLSDDEAAFRLADLVDAVRRTVLGFWPSNQVAAGNESEWLMDQLTDIDGALYDRYLRLHDQTQSTNFAYFAEPLDYQHVKTAYGIDFTNPHHLVVDRDLAIGWLGEDAVARLEEDDDPPLTH